MIFTSGTFFWFFILVYALFLALPSVRARKSLLLFASYAFYASWNWHFLGLILLSSSVDFWAGRQIERSHHQNSNTRAWRFLLISLGANFSILGFFKYFDFFSQQSGTVFSWLGFDWHPLLLELVLPLGISFYTFQSVSYSIDVYRKRIPATKSFFDFLLYVAFFPQLIAGPIERAKHLLPQFNHLRRPERAELNLALGLIFWGVFKKVFIADNLAPYTHWAVGTEGVAHGADTWLTGFIFSVRFYCDFSAYSEIAMGLGRLMGVHLHRNFRWPYLAANPVSLWRRWHITMTYWFLDYVYRPLVTRTSNRWAASGALLFTFILIGFWHGADWRFIFWGGSWGLVLLIHRALRPARRWLHTQIPLPLMKVFGIGVIWALWSMINTFFVAPTLDQSLRLFSQFFSLSASSQFLPDMMTTMFYCLPLAVVEGLQFIKKDFYALERVHWTWRLVIYTLLTYLMLGGYALGGKEFIYFQF